MHFSWAEATVQSINELLATCKEEHDAATKLRDLLGSDPDDHYHALMRALDYMRTYKSTDDDENVSVYAPVMEWANGAKYPEDLSEASDDTLKAWQDAYELFKADLVTARLGDLLWIRRFGNKPYLYVKDSLDALSRMATDPGRIDLYRAEDLIRAMTLAVEINDQDSLTRLVGLTVEATRTSIRGDDWQPGVAMLLLTHLVQLPKKSRPADISALVSEASDAYQSDPFVFQQVVELRLELAGATVADRQSAALQGIKAWEAAAERAPGLVAHMHLRRAIEIAQREGLQAEAERITLQLQSSEANEPDFQVLTADATIPKVKVEAFINAFTNGEDPEVWLMRLAGHTPINVDREAVVTETQEQMKQHPIQFLATRIIYNREGLPLHEVSYTDEARLEQAMRDNESLALGIWATLLDEIFGRLVTQGLTAEEFAEYFEGSPLFTPTAIDSVRRGFQHFLDGHYHEAGILIIPCLEAAIRTVAKLTGLVIYQLPTGGRTGGYKALGELLRTLTGRMDEHERRHLSLLLSDPLSHNLRNLTLHGLHLNLSRSESALVLHAALLIGSWRIRNAEEPTTESPDPAPNATEG